MDAAIQRSSLASDHGVYPRAVVALPKVRHEERGAPVPRTMGYGVNGQASGRGERPHGDPFLADTCEPTRAP
jgi:hypothetical protein